MSRHAYRAALLHTPQDPEQAPGSVVHHRDGLLVVEDGHIVASGGYAELADRFADIPTTALPNRLITPGFVDAHVHFPQVDVIAAGAGQLLDWLTNHTFPAELAFADRSHADATATFFLDQLLANGTTSALVFCSVHAASVDALFEAALSRNMRLAAGKVLMDRNAPAGLLDTAESGPAESEMLIRRWRGRGRLSYAVTPRFALSCSDAQLAAAGELVAAHPDVLVHTHMSENPAEIAEVGRLFPHSRDYLDVYDRYGLLTQRSVFAHCVHADEGVLGRMAAAGASAAFCPSSNMLLGSGLFSLKTACRCGVNVALGTDVGGGHSFSIPAMMGEAYKVGQLLGDGQDPLKAFYLATMGGAKALKIGDRVGSLEAGKEADFVMIDLTATPLLARRTAATRTPSDLLFVLSLLADDRAIERTYLAGALAHQRT